MKLTATLRMSFVSLSRNPTRTLLTTLGIVIGIGAVITMMEIGNGSKTSLRSTIEKMGANSVMVMPGAMRMPGSPRKEMGSAVTLTPADADAIRQECPSVGKCSPVVRGSGTQIVFGNATWLPAAMYGVSPDYLDIRNWQLAEGRCFTDNEVDTNARVCVIGSTIVKELFNGMSPVGSELRIGDVAFEVVGVLKSKGANMIGMDEDDVIMAPWSTLQMRVTGLKMGSATNTTSTVSNYPGDRFVVSGVALYPEQDISVTRDKLFYSRFSQLNQIVFEAVSTDKVEDALKEVSDVLRRRHRIYAGKEDDFHIRNSADFMNMLNSTSTLMTNLLLGVALISLIVGGVGIMNIMLVSVTERTREIGLRMAVGARSKDILLQFLIETVFLTTSGGITGILVGVGIGKIITNYSGMETIYSWWSIVLALAISCVVGIIFGTYPAYQAAQQNPITVLRSE